MSREEVKEAGQGGSAEESTPSNFIRTIIEEDLRCRKNDGRVVTRFPPEPNGYLHIGHAKSICLNFGLARDYRGRCHLRFDDTNPTKEEVEYVESIMTDVRWLGFSWGEHLYFASDYFDRLYDFAVDLIKRGKAYVCNLTPDEIRAYRGTLTEPGRESPSRDRPIAESLDLFARMRAGEFAEGTHVLRAKIDMVSGNLNLRDPIIYRILHAEHHRTGAKWCIYPMYDYAHALSDSIEGITHSICTLEFEDHRPLYDWCLDTLERPCHPQQIEFARLNLSYTIVSKRKLLKLVNEGQVSGWNDPRMPTLSGIRRRGYPPAAIRAFCERIGVAKRDSIVDMELLEFSVRDELNQTAPRLMAVVNPLKVVLTNFPEGAEEIMTAQNHPDNPAMGTRPISFTRELYIERDDFMEEAPKKFYRLAPGREVRLRYGFFIQCQEVVKDPATGEIIELRCTYDPATRGGNAPDGRKVKATIHWVAAAHSLPAEIRLYDRLFTVPDPDRGRDGADFMTFLNPQSMETRQGRVEKAIAGAAPGAVFQFERLGYFCIDSVDSGPERLVINRTVTLRDTWAKVARSEAG